MKIKNRKLHCVVYTFYITCSSSAAVQAEPTSQIERLRNQLIKPSAISSSELRELTSDYLYLLDKNAISSEVQLQSLLDITKPQDNAQFADRSGTNKWHWLRALNHYRVKNKDCLKKLNDALTVYRNSAPDAMMSREKGIFTRLAAETNRFKATSKEDQKLKAETLWKLALSVQHQRRQLEQELVDLAVVQLIKSEDVSIDEKRSALNKAISTYNSSDQPTKAMRKGLRKTLDLMIKTATQYSDRYIFSSPESIFPVLIRILETEDAINTQKKLVSCAENLKFDQTILMTLQFQLACGYLAANHLKQAETLLRLQKQNPIAQLCLAECLRRQKRLAEVDELTAKIKKTKFSSKYKYPTQYVAMASAVQGQTDIDRKQFEKALPHLDIAYEWSRKTISTENDDIRGSSYMWEIFPTFEKIIQNQILCHSKIGHDDTAKSKIAELKQLTNAKLLDKLARERTGLSNLANMLATPDQSMKEANQMIKISELTERNLSARISLLLNYAESLIGSKKFDSAAICLQKIAALIKSTTEKPNGLDARVKSDLVLLKITEATHQAIDSQNFELAEFESRPLEADLGAIMSMSSESSNDDQKKEKFVETNQRALIERVQCLVKLRRFDDAARICRSILSWSRNAEVEIDALANLAVCYERSGHSGLMQAVKQQASIRAELIGSYSCSQYIADAKAQLATLEDSDQNALRAERYRAEAKEILEAKNKIQ